MSEPTRATGRPVPVGVPAGVPAGVPVSAPPRLRDLLRRAPDGPVPVVHHGPLATYLELGGRCVGVVAPAAVQVPCALRSRNRHDDPWRGDSAYLEGGVLHLDSRPLVVGRIVDVHVPRLDRVSVPRITSSSTVLASPPAAVVELFSGSIPPTLDAAWVERLIGRGDGLTPLGDDVLCGWLATHRAGGVATPEVDRAVRSSAGRTTLLSATLLDCALHGEVLPQHGSYLAALGTPAEAARAADLLGVGGSSGAGLLHGTALALVALHRSALHRSGSPAA